LAALPRTWCRLRICCAAYWCATWGIGGALYRISSDERQATEAATSSKNDSDIRIFLLTCFLQRNFTSARVAGDRLVAFAQLRVVDRTFDLLKRFAAKPICRR